MPTYQNGSETLLPVTARDAGTVTSDPVEMLPGTEGERIICFSDVEATLKVVPYVQGDYRDPCISETVLAGETHIIAILFPLERFKVSVTTVDPSNYGVAVRSYNIT